MKHETAGPLIGDLLHDRLNARTRLSVITHVVTCDDCRALVDTYLTIWAGLRGDGAGEIHPSSESIVCFAVAAPSTAARDDAWIKKHVLRCTTCRMEVESVEHAERTLALFETRPEPDFALPLTRTIQSPRDCSSLLPSFCVQRARSAFDSSVT